jgi:hypothetical protein
VTDVDDFLAHYGVKGMHWGHHKARETSGSSKKSRKQTRQERNAEILNARSRQQARGRAYEEAQAEFMAARTRKGEAKAEEVMRRMEKEYWTHPDAQTAQKLTTGEKIAVGLAYGSVGLTAASIILRAAR